VKPFSILAALALGASSGECTVATDVPLGQPEAISFDRALLGSWSCVNSATPEEAGPVHIYAFSDSEYYIQAGPADDQGHMRGFGARVDGQRFLNVQELGFASPGAYSILGYNYPSSTTLRVRLAELPSGEQKPRTREAMRSFVRQALSAGELFSADHWRCKRAES